MIQYQPTNLKWISTGPLDKIGKFHLAETANLYTWLENSTHPLVFTSASGCMASENFEISSEFFTPKNANIFKDAGQVPILRYFEACIPAWILMVHQGHHHLHHHPSHPQN